MTPNELEKLEHLLSLAIDYAKSMREHHAAEGPSGMLGRATWGERLDRLRAARQSVASIRSEA